MRNKITLIKNNENLQLSDVEWVDRFYEFIQQEIKLDSKKAFRVIYYLQEHLPVFPDQIEQCNTCGTLYDSWSEGYHSEMLGKNFCGESCEPPRLYEREQCWEKRRAKKVSAQQEGGSV